MLGFGNLGRRLVESVVGLFAILGFLYVPLGRSTGFEHAKAVLGTPAAAAAIEDLTTTALDLRRRVVDFVTGRVSATAEANGQAASPVESPKARVGREPRPVPPKLK